MSPLPPVASASALPTVGSVYDEFNLGNGYENIYTDISSATGGSDTVTDTLVTPNGDVNLDSLFGNIDAAALMQPGDAFTGLEVGNISGAADAFSIGGFTLDPTLAAGGEGFDGVTPLATARRRCWRSVARRSVTRPTVATTSPPRASTS